MRRTTSNVRGEGGGGGGDEEGMQRMKIYVCLSWERLCVSCGVLCR